MELMPGFTCETIERVNIKDCNIDIIILQFLECPSEGGGCIGNYLLTMVTLEVFRPRAKSVWLEAK